MCKPNVKKTYQQDLVVESLSVFILNFSFF